MTNIQSKRLIVVKGLLFILITVGAGVGIVCTSPSFTVVALVLTLIWASARSYYFLFYVLEKYVDPSLKYTGLLDLARHLIAPLRR